MKNIELMAAIDAIKTEFIVTSIQHMDPQEALALPKFTASWV
jgi:hypothetical protein